jgi:hypothetical protein
MNLSKSEAVLISNLLIAKGESISFEEYQLLNRLNKEFDLIDKSDLVF